MLPRLRMVTIKNRARSSKLQTSNFKLQRKFKLQASIERRAFGADWRLNLGASLKFEAWSLKFGCLKQVNIAKALLQFCALLLVAGCTRPGPSALLDGKRLIERGRYPEAVERLKVATSLLATNAQAWNYFGLACQYAGQARDAQSAYERAIKLDNDLSEARYNLGCLVLSQNKLEPAKTELTAFTLRRGSSVAGFLKLGEVEMRLGELGAAERCFNEVLRFDAQQPEALNGLGLARLRHGRASEASQLFTRALKQRPDYRPALLNLAIVSHEYLKDRPLALQKYREYAALTPPPPDREVVKELAHELELELNPPARLAAASPAVASMSSGVPSRSPSSNTATAPPP